MPKNLGLVSWMTFAWCAFGTPNSNGETIYGVTDGKVLHAIDTATGVDAVVGSIATTALYETYVNEILSVPEGGLFGISTGTPPSFSGYIYQLSSSDADSVLVGAVGPLDVQAAAVDPTDGWLYQMAPAASPFGSAGEITLVRTHPSFLTGFVLGTFPATIGDFVDIAFDASGQMYALNAVDDALWLVDKSNPGGPNTARVGSGLGSGLDLSGGASMSYQHSTGGTYGYERSSGRLFSIDLSTGLASMIVPLTNAPPFRDISVIGCDSPSVPYGAAGCPIGPRISMEGCPETGSPVTVRIDHNYGPVVSSALVFVGINETVVPGLPDFCLQVDPAIFLVALPSTWDGNVGSSMVTGLIPPSAAGSTFRLQAFVPLPGSFLGGLSSNGLRVSVP